MGSRQRLKEEMELNSSKSLGLLALLFVAAAAVSGLDDNDMDRIDYVTLKTADCTECGMKTGQVSLEVCGVSGCCATGALVNEDGDGEDHGFERNTISAFTGPSTLDSCDQFDLTRHTTPALFSLTIQLSGSDNVKFENV